jgi:SAM-dependent methyltransferase
MKRSTSRSSSTAGPERRSARRGRSGPTAPTTTRRAPVNSHQRMHEATWTRADAEAMLESSERRATQDPGRLWRRVALRPGETVVDVGAGSGYFSFPAADAVGPTGHVYAVDVSGELVELIRERANERRTSNLTALRSTPARIPLNDGVADVALLANVLHGVPPSTVAEAVRTLRPGGRLVNVDWKKVTTPSGPPLQHRLSETEATRALVSHGLVPRDSFELGPYHYVLVFERPAPAHRARRLVSAE